jgi:hypothetical protein
MCGVDSSAAHVHLFLPNRGRKRWTLTLLKNLILFVAEYGGTPYENGVR